MNELTRSRLKTKTSENVRAKCFFVLLDESKIHCSSLKTIILKFQILLLHIRLLCANKDYFTLLSVVAGDENDYD